MTSLRIGCAIASCLALSCAVSGPAAGQNPGFEPPPEFAIDANGWTGGAVAMPDDPRRVGYCGVRRDYDNGITLLFTMNPSYVTQIGLINEGWSLEEGFEEEVRLQIDSTIEGQAQAIAAAPSILLVPVGDDLRLIEILKTGSNLNLSTSLGDYDFPLTGTFQGLDALRACAETARDYVAPVAETSPEPDDGDTGPSGPRREAVIDETALTEILIASGLEDVTVQAQEDAEETGVAFTWTVGTLSGGLYQQPRGTGMAIAAFAEEFVGRMEALCPGQFRKSLGEPEVYRDTYAVMTTSLQCEYPEGTNFVSAVLTLDDFFYSAFYHESSFSEAQRVLTETSKVEAFVRRLASGSE